MEVGIGIGREGKRGEAARHDINAKLLGELPDQCCLRRFTGVDLTTGKLPQTRHRFTCRPFGEEHPTIGVDQRHRRDEHDGGLSCGSWH